MNSVIKFTVRVVRQRPPFVFGCFGHNGLFLMPIVIKTGNHQQTRLFVSVQGRARARAAPDGTAELLSEEVDPRLAFVGSQVILLDTGRLELLFVTSDGLPVVVEVKLARNV